MTDDTDITLEQRKSFKRDCNNWHRKNPQHYTLLFQWPYWLLRKHGGLSSDGPSDLYLRLLGLAWNGSERTAEGLPKITLQLKPIYEHLGVPARTFQCWLKKLEKFGLIKRIRLINDQKNGNRTKIIVWLPKFYLKLLIENDQNGAETPIGFPFWSADNDPKYALRKRLTTTTVENIDSSCESSRESSTNGVHTLALQKKRLKKKEAAQRKSDGSNRKRQSTKRPKKHTQAGLIAWYRQQIRKRYGHNPSVNPLALRTKKWGPKRWKIVYAVLGTIIKDWDDFINAQSKAMKSPPAYPPLEWINSWWNAFSGWHKAHQNTTSDVTKSPKRLTSGYRKLPI